MAGQFDTELHAIEANIGTERVSQFAACSPMSLRTSRIGKACHKHWNAYG